MRDPVILVTGVTGFLGGAAVAQYLQSGAPGRVLLLVRGDSPTVAEARVHRSLVRFADLAALQPALQRCEVICADLTDARALADPRLDAVTHVLHLAANTSFRSVRAVRHTNILGTLTLAHRLRGVPGLQRFLYVSTAYLCGEAPPRVVEEDMYPRPDVRHIVEYTSSKAECEMLLENTAPELPWVVGRPSVVIGHTQLGCEPSASLFWLYRTFDLLRRLPFSLEVFDDVIPVDYAAEALLFLLQKPQLHHRRYHVSAGEKSAVTWEEIAAAFARCHGERPENPYRKTDFATVRDERHRLSKLLGPGDEDHLLMALELYWRIAAVGVEIFDNRRLLAEGMRPAPRFTSYLPLCATRPPGRSVYQQMLDDE